uniref:Retrotransposon protein, putative, Ty3-gypsy subclass n=1 Tax=Oryza sativa subsp. japonica TaxID=39947 RepID=Q2QWL5_ORYSJ|nr:retrotransposon protein, putative, Ty3-gypsy subclass [Oryza sativa Japonica Group]
MGFISGIDDFAFPPEQAYRFGNLDFITDNIGKISLLESDSNQSGGDPDSTPFGLPESAEIYSKVLSSTFASNHSVGISVSSSSRLNQDGVVYPPIMMRLPDDLAAVFDSRAPSPQEIEEYLTTPSVDSHPPTEIIDYGDFDDEYDFHNFDEYDDLDEDFDDNYKDNYTPLFFGVFMVDNETKEKHLAREADEQRARQEVKRLRLEQERQAQEQARLLREQQDRERLAREAEERRQRALASGRQAQELIRQQDIDTSSVFCTPQQNTVAAITLLDTLLTAGALDHVATILDQTKMMIAASVLVNLGSTQQHSTAGLHLSDLRTITNQALALLIQDHVTIEGHIGSTPCTLPPTNIENIAPPVIGSPSTYVTPSIVALRTETTDDATTHRIATMGTIESPLSQVICVEWIGWLVSSRPVSRSMMEKLIPSHGSLSTPSQSAQQEEIARQ